MSNKVKEDEKVLMLKKIDKLKSLILLTDDSVSNEQVGELSLKQWQAFVEAFPEELK